MITTGFILGLVAHLVIAAPFHDDRNVCTTPECEAAASYLSSSMNSNVNPCDDFYEFACGFYGKSDEVPWFVDYWNQLVEMMSQLEDRLQAIIENANNQNTHYSFLVDKLYQGCTQNYYNTELAVDSIRNLFKEFGGWVVLEDGDWSKIDWKEISYKLRSKGIPVRGFLPIGVTLNSYHANKYAMQIGVPDFIVPQEHLTQGFSDPIVLRYKRRIMTLIEQMGVYESEYAAKEVDNFIELEIELAKIVDLKKMNLSTGENMTLEQLQRDYSAIPWKIYLENMIGLPGIELDDQFIIHVASVDYLKHVNEILNNFSSKTLASYIQFKAVVAILNTVGMGLSPADFPTKSYNPVNVLMKRERSGESECVSIVAGVLPIALSALYVREYLTPAIKSDVEDMVKEIKIAFIQLLQANNWLDEHTKATAIKKVANVVEHVAYPKELLDDKLLDDIHSPVNYSENYIEFYFNIAKFSTDFTNSKFDEVRDSTDWVTHSALTNIRAFYIPAENSINILAAFIRDPIYQLNVPNYVNYPSIGSVTGHEINHGIGGIGAEFDEYGQLNFWFTPNATKEYDKRALCLSEQYTAQSNNSATAKLTLNEDIADSGGIIAAYKAYEDWVHKNHEESGLPGLNYTAKQLFWISYARMWCAKETDTYITQISPYENHSRSPFRVRVPLMNSPEFSRDFNCPAGSYMNPINKCELLA